MRMPWILPLIAVMALTAVGGCSLPDPYVYRNKEFDRDLATFGKEPKDLATVGICYNKKNTTPQQIIQMAQAECAKYHKVARFSRQTRLQCPLLTPVEAIFLCEPSGGQSGSSSPFLY